MVCTTSASHSAKTTIYATNSIPTTLYKSIPLHPLPPLHPPSGELITALKAVGVWDVLAAVFLSRLKANKQRARVEGGGAPLTAPHHHEGGGHEGPTPAAPSVSVSHVSGSAPPWGGGSQTVGSWGAQVSSSLGATPSQSSFKRPPRSPRPEGGHAVGGHAVGGNGAGDGAVPPRSPGNGRHGMESGDHHHHHHGHQQLGARGETAAPGMCVYV